MGAQITKTLLKRLELKLTEIAEDETLDVSKRLEASRLFIDLRKQNPLAKRNRKPKQAATSSTVLGTR